MSRIAVLGATGWGTTLAMVFARKGDALRTTLLARAPKEAKMLDDERQNKRFVPGVRFPDSLNISSASESEPLSSAEVIVIAVPSVSMQENLQQIKENINPNAVLISATKGIEPSSGRRMTQIIADETEVGWERIGALSGPNLAREIAKGLPASATVGMLHSEEAMQIQSMLTSDSFRIYASDDITGVEFGGALKNIIAIGAGVIDGMGLGENTKAAFITRGLHEMTRFGVAFGAKVPTLYGLAGMGDLMATCHSNLSRNRALGLELAKGASLKEALKSIGHVAEGVNTTKAVARLAWKVGIDMPITFVTSEILEGKLPIKGALHKLMRREPQPENLLL